MIRICATIALLLSTTALSTAQSLDEEVAAFIEAEGFVRQDVMALETALSDNWLDTVSVSPGGLVGPIEKAVMIADEAIPSTRTRTEISYGEIIADDNGAPLPVSFITVRHFNLGEVIRAETAEAYGEENTAGIEEFGLGDHMEWRFVFHPLMGNTAVMLDASSRVIPADEAEISHCGGRLCLDPYMGFEDVEWEEIPATLPAWPELYPTVSDEIATPAHAIAQLAVLGFWANVESGFYQWTGGEHPESIRGSDPYRFIDIDRNLGQEVSIDTAWRETQVNDDSLYAIMFRRADVAGQVYLMRASQPR